MPAELLTAASSAFLRASPHVSWHHGLVKGSGRDFPDTDRGLVTIQGHTDLYFVLVPELGGEKRDNLAWLT